MSKPKKHTRAKSFYDIQVSKILFNRLCKRCDNFKEIIKNIPYGYVIGVRDREKCFSLLKPCGKSTHFLLRKRIPKGMWLVHVRYSDKEVKFYAKSPDEVIFEILGWFRRNFEPKEWPSILKMIEGKKE